MNTTATDDRYRRAAAAGGVGIWDWNLDSGEIFVDPILKDMLGYQDHEIRNHLDDWGRFVHPDDAAAVFERAQAHIAGLTPLYEAEHRMLHRDGSIRWFLARGTVVRDASGRAVSMSGTDTDITERKRSEQALRQSEARNRAILLAIPDGMFLVDADGGLLEYHCRGSCGLIDPAADHRGRHVRDLLPVPLLARFEAAFQRVKATDGPEVIECSLGTDEAERFYEASIVSCDGDKILSVVRDVTDRKRAEIDAAARRRDLAHLGRVVVLGELTGALAHELSQPLTAMLNNALAARYLLDQEPIDVAELAAALDDVIKDSNRAGQVIERLRLLLRKEEAPLRLIDLSEIVREVVDLARSEIVTRRVTLTSTLKPGMPLVAGDRVQLQQVVLNLLVNACEAMSEVPVSQRRLALATDADDGFVHLVVADCGVGIPADQIERVFEPFVTFREHGLGLGLAITRSIVIAHRGSIRAEANAEGGATFSCSLPIADAGAMQHAM